uniref:DEP domain containing MTOR-interacting protein n=1 Tax=Mus musculus TaxID=10090 RepID=A0A2I3BRE1_MOUSE
MKQAFLVVLRHSISEDRLPPLSVITSGCRLRLHEEKVIKDRRHHLKTYPNCFVAKELIDWLIEHKEASDRETAIKLMQKLADRGIIHHGRMMGPLHWTVR